ncbi:MAG: hypothetical protein WDO73_19085 [Ignavibacteriota bacterium]
MRRFDVNQNPQLRLQLKIDVAKAVRHNRAFFDGCQTSSGERVFDLDSVDYSH